MDEATRQALEAWKANPDQEALLMTMERGMPGTTESYRLLRKEMIERPLQVVAAIKRYQAQVGKLVELAARKNANLAKWKHEADEVLRGLAVADAAAAAVNKVPIVGQIVGSLMGIAENIVKAYAELKAAGIDRGYGGVVFNPGDPIRWGWFDGGYWIYDAPVFSLSAPLQAAQWNARGPGFLDQNNGVKHLAIRHPYGLPFNSVTSDGYWDQPRNDDPSGKPVGWIYHIDKEARELTLDEIAQRAGGAPQGQLTPTGPGWQSVLALQVRLYHDGYYSRAPYPVPAGFDAQAAQQAQESYALGQADRAQGLPDRYAGQTGLDEGPNPAAKETNPMPDDGRGWQSGVSLGLTFYHDGYYGRPLRPVPPGYDAAQLQGLYGQGAQDRGQGLPDRFPDTKGAGEPGGPDYIPGTEPVPVGPDYEKDWLRIERERMRIDAILAGLNIVINAPRGGGGAAPPYRATRTFELVARVRGKIVPLDRGRRIKGAILEIVDTPQEGTGLAGRPGAWTRIAQGQPPGAFGLDEPVVAWDGQRGRPVSPEILNKHFGPDWTAGLN